MIITNTITFSTIVLIECGGPNPTGQGRTTSLPPSSVWQGDWSVIQRFEVWNWQRQGAPPPPPPRTSSTTSSLSKSKPKVAQLNKSETGFFSEVRKFLIMIFTSFRSWWKFDRPSSLYQGSTLISDSQEEEEAYMNTKAVVELTAGEHHHHHHLSHPCRHCPRDPKTVRWH